MTEQQIPDYNIPGINAEQADKVVELAYEVNALRELNDHPNRTVAETAKNKIAENESMIGILAGQRALEVVPVITEISTQSEKPPVRTYAGRRKRVLKVVDPGSGRIVPYGQMRHGDHPQGGRIVGYR